MSKIILSFDDGRRDNLRAAQEILVPLGIPATMNLTTGYIDGSAREERHPGPNPALSMEEARELASLPNIEIAGHGWEHLNTMEDLQKGVTTLREWFPERTIAGLASPNSILREEEILFQQAAYEAMGLSYVRIGAGATYSGIRRVMGKLSRMIPSKWLFITSNKGAIAHTLDRFVLTAVPVMRQPPSGQVEALVRYCAKHDYDLILMFHSIVKAGEDFHEDTWSWDYDDFAKLCKTLQNMQQANEITLATTAEAVAD